MDSWTVSIVSVYEFMGFIKWQSFKIGSTTNIKMTKGYDLI
jgi:hypothetical protein